MINKKSDDNLLGACFTFRKDKNVKSYALNTDVVEGEVQLQGVDDTLQEKRRAERLVEQPPEIKTIHPVAQPPGCFVLLS